MPFRIKHKATGLLMHLENGNDLWSRDEEDAAQFPTKRNAIEEAKKHDLSSKEYETVGT